MQYNTHIITHKHGEIWICLTKKSCIFIEEIEHLKGMLQFQSKLTMLLTEVNRNQTLMNCLFLHQIYSVIELKKNQCSGGRSPCILEDGERKSLYKSQMVSWIKINDMFLHTKQKTRCSATIYNRHIIIHKHWEIWVCLKQKMLHIHRRNRTSKRVSRAYHCLCCRSSTQSLAALVGGSSSTSYSHCPLRGHG